MTRCNVTGLKLWLWLLCRLTIAANNLESSEHPGGEQKVSHEVRIRKTAIVLLLYVVDAIQQCVAMYVQLCCSRRGIKHAVKVSQQRHIVLGPVLLIISYEL